MGSFSFALLEGGNKMGLGSTALGILLFIGVARCDQSAYPSGSVGAPLTQEYADTSLVDNTAYYGQNDYSQGAYDYAQYSDTDRTAELIDSVVTIPMAIMAFLAALLGSVTGPILAEGITRIVNFEFELPELPRIKDSARGFTEPTKHTSSLFKLAAEKLITSAVDRLRQVQ